MISFKAPATTSTMLVVLSRGDYVIEELTALLKKEGISTALITSGIGSLDICKLHTITTSTIPAGEHYYQLEGPVEVGSLQGSVAGGVPHIHIVVDDVPNHTVHVGHLEEGSRVCFRMELGIVALDGVATASVKNQENGLIDIVEA